MEVQVLVDSVSIHADMLDRLAVFHGFHGVNVVVCFVIE